MSDKIVFTPEQVVALNKEQERPDRHPYTCGDCPSSGVQTSLVATIYGWKCPREGCNYTQDWAHQIPKM